MNERETAEAIEGDAIHWVARIDREGEDPHVRAELEAWLAADDRRRGAWLRAQAAWRLLDRAIVLRGGRADMPAQSALIHADAGDEPAEQPGRAPRPSRRAVIWGGAAAAASVAAALAGYTLLLAPVERIETAVGEIRRVPLRDGSLIAVNTATSIAVDLQPDRRRIQLAAGEAWFQVAPDRSRPFVVEAGDVRVQALGTAFSVRRGPNGADVQVTEGVVEIWSTGNEASRRRVAAGSRAFVGTTEGPQRITQASADIERSLSWRSGQLIFDGDTLGQAAAEFNRYNHVQVRIDDPALAGERFVGRFRTNEPDAFARAAATILGADAEFGADEIRLARN